MVYSRRWEEEDSEKTPLEMTVTILRETVTGVETYLEFTFETGADFEDGWLPTLDTSLRVNKDNQVDFKYFEKPTTTNTTIKKSTAMGENAKVQCLANDLVRRLLNTREDLPSHYRKEVVNGSSCSLVDMGRSRPGGSW